jgi:transcription antitermination factor NusG
MQQWFAVKTHPKREQQVRAVLSRSGVEVYVPQIAVRRRGGFAPRLELLFPGYVFSRLELGTSQWIAARSAPGVAYFLGAAGAPTALPDDMVECIRVRAEARSTAAVSPAFSRGDRVLIKGGPFDGLEAVFDGTLSGAARVRVLLQMVNRLVAVALDPSFLFLTT